MQLSSNKDKHLNQNSACILGMTHWMFGTGIYDGHYKPTPKVAKKAT